MPGDLVSGAVIASFVIVTFLCFMSFADFLRFNRQDGAPGNNHNRGRQQEEENRGDWDMAVVQLEIINRMKEYVGRANSDHEDGTSVDDAEDRRHELQQMRELVKDMEKLIHPLPNEVPRTEAREQELQRHDQTRELLEMLEELEADNEEMREKAHKEALAKQALRNSLAEVIREQEQAAQAAEADDGDEHDEQVLPPAANNVDHDHDVGERQPRVELPMQPPAFDRFDRVDMPPPGLLPEEDVVSAFIVCGLNECV